MPTNIYAKLKTIDKKASSFNCLVILVFIAVGSVGILHHEMWRDELEAWLIAKDSFSFAELQENLKYTGHPVLWYLCLHFLAKISHNPAIMQLFNLIAITAAIFTFLYYSPFDKLQKGLFSFSYFPLYEYGIISRSYSLGILLLFSFCALFCSTRRNYILLAVVLALLSHTHVYGLIIGLVLASNIAMTVLNETLSNKKFLSGKHTVWQIGIGLIVYLFGLLTAVIQIIPPANAENISIATESVETSSSLFEVFLSSGRILTGIWRSYIPISNFSFDDAWGSNILADNSFLPDLVGIELGSLISAILSLAFLLIFAFIFARNPKILLTYIAGNLLLMMFGIMFKYPSLRHNGHLFMLLIVCFWLYICEAEANARANFKVNFNSVLQRFSIDSNARQENFLLTILLCVQLYAGLKMYAVDSVRVFSNSKNVAQYIEQNKLASSTIIGSDYTIVFPLSAWLDREIYYPEIQKFGSFTVWTAKSSKLNSDITLAEIFEEAEKLKRRSDRDLLLVLDRQIPETQSPANVKPLASFEGAIEERENYFIYSFD